MTDVRRTGTVYRRGRLSTTVNIPPFQCVSVARFLSRSLDCLADSVSLPVCLSVTRCLRLSHVHTYTYVSSLPLCLSLDVVPLSAHRQRGDKSGASTGRPSRRLAASETLAELVHEIRMKSRRYVVRRSVPPISAHISGKDGSD